MFVQMVEVKSEDFYFLQEPSSLSERRTLGPGWSVEY